MRSTCFTRKTASATLLSLVVVLGLAFSVPSSGNVRPYGDDFPNQTPTPVVKLAVGGKVRPAGDDFPNLRSPGGSIG